MKKPLPSRDASRRTFIKKSALTAAAVVAGCSPRLEEVARAPEPAPSAAPATGAVLGANDRVVVGFVGVGGQGYRSHVTNVANRHADGRPVHEHAYNAVGAAVCDVYTHRRDRAAALLDSGEDASVDRYDDYRRILDRDDIDAVFVGTVDHWHARIAIDALEAGKHVYCEKPMTRYLGEAFDIYDAVRRSGRTFQIGSQYCTEGKWHLAADMIRDGRIGPLVFAQDSYMRNVPDGEWNYEIDPEVSPETLDWEAWLGPVSDRPFSADEYHRWRKYYAYCAGILGDLLAHRIHPLLLATGAPEFPTRVACLGTRNVTPDRDVPDNTQLIAEFPGGYTMMVTGSTVNEQGLGQVIRGHEATLYFSGNTLEMRPERPFADLVDRDVHENITPGASIPAHMANFFEAVRGNETPNGDIDLAVKAQTIVSLAEMSERLGLMLHFDPETRTVTRGDGTEVEPITYGTLERS